MRNKAIEQQFRADHPETVGETDRDFDNTNYIEWLEQKLAGAAHVHGGWSDEDMRQAFEYFQNQPLPHDDVLYLTFEQFISVMKSFSENPLI